MNFNPDWRVLRSERRVANVLRALGAMLLALGGDDDDEAERFRPARRAAYAAPGGVPPRTAYPPRGGAERTMTQPPFESWPEPPADDVSAMLADARNRAQAVIDDAVERAQALLQDQRQQQQQQQSSASAAAGEQSIEQLRRMLSDLATEVRAIHLRIDSVEMLLRSVSAQPMPMPVFTPPVYAMPPQVPFYASVPPAAAPPAPAAAPPAAPEATAPEVPAPAPAPAAAVPAPPAAATAPAPNPRFEPPPRPAEPVAPPPVPAARFEPPPPQAVAAAPPATAIEPPAPVAPAPQPAQAAASAPPPVQPPVAAPAAAAPQAAPPPPVAAPTPAPVAEPAARSVNGTGFDPDGGSVALRISPVAGFQGLMRVQDALVRVPGVREAGVEAYAQGEARLRLQLAEHVDPQQLASALGELLGRTARLTSSSVPERIVQLALE